MKLPPPSRTKFVKLPRVVDVPKRPKVEPPKPLQKPALSSDPIIAILNDATLRQGDVVAFSDGLKVFEGTSKPPYSLADFRDFERSKAVNRQTRKLLVAMTRPASKSPTREAKRQVALPDTTGSVLAPAQVSQAIRVVYPASRNP